MMVILAGDGDREESVPYALPLRSRPRALAAAPSSRSRRRPRPSPEPDFLPPPRRLGGRPDFLASAFLPSAPSPSDQGAFSPSSFSLKLEDELEELDSSSD